MLITLGVSLVVNLLLIAFIGMEEYNRQVVLVGCMSFFIGFFGPFLFKG